MEKKENEEEGKQEWRGHGEIIIGQKFEQWECEEHEVIN